MEKTADVYRIINMFFVGQSGSEWVRVGQCDDSDHNVSLQTPSQCSKRNTSAQGVEVQFLLPLFDTAIEEGGFTYA